MQKKTVVITGASSGIGAAMACLFSKAGYPVGLIARRVEKMDDLGLPKSLSIKADVCDFQVLKGAFAKIESTLGPVECLINNAGFARPSQMTPEEHDTNKKIVDVQLQGVVNCIEIVLPGMRKRKSGTLINVCSTSGLSPRPIIPVFAATKAAVYSFSESLRIANVEHGIRVCNLTPARTDTPLLGEAAIKDENIMAPEDVARIALMVHEQPKDVCIRHIVFGHTYNPV